MPTVQITPPVQPSRLPASTLMLAHGFSIELLVESVRCRARERLQTARAPRDKRLAPLDFCYFGPGFCYFRLLLMGWLGGGSQSFSADGPTPSGGRTKPPHEGGQSRDGHG